METIEQYDSYCPHEQKEVEEPKQSTGYSLQGLLVTDIIQKFECIEGCGEFIRVIAWLDMDKVSEYNRKLGKNTISKF